MDNYIQFNLAELYEGKNTKKVFISYQQIEREIFHLINFNII